MKKCHVRKIYRLKLEFYNTNRKMKNIIRCILNFNNQASNFHALFLKNKLQNCIRNFCFSQWAFENSLNTALYCVILMVLIYIFIKLSFWQKKITHIAKTLILHYFNRMLLYTLIESLLGYSFIYLFSAITGFFLAHS